MFLHLTARQLAVHADWAGRGTGHDPRAGEMARKLAGAAAEASIVRGMIAFTGADGWHTVHATNGRTWIRGDDEKREAFTHRVEHAAGECAERTVIVLPSNGREEMETVT